MKGIKFKSVAKKAWDDFKFFLSNPVPLSFSKMSTYQTCAYKYKLIYIDGQPGKPSPALSYGTIMHNTLYEFESIPHGAKREYADLERLFQKNWDLEIGSYRRKWGKSMYELIAAEKNTPAEELEREAWETGILILKNYWREAGNNPNKVRYVEKWLGGEIGKYHVTGRLDRLDQRPDGAYEIVDYKTGQRIHNEDTLKDASRGYGLQAGLYYEMCREAWHDRVDRFIFKYIQKRQSILEYLVGQWVDRAHAAAIAGLAGEKSPAMPDAPGLSASTEEILNKSLRDKLEEKLVKKVMMEEEETRVRGEIRKITANEEEEMLGKVDAGQRPTARLFLKALNKALEVRINEELTRAMTDPVVIDKHKNGAREAIRGILSHVDGQKTGAAAKAWLEEVDLDVKDRAASSRWQGLPVRDRDRIAEEIIEIVHHKDVKETCARYLKDLKPETLGQAAKSALEPFAEIRADKRDVLVRYVVDRLRESFSRQLDVYTADEIARILSESAPADFFTDEYTKRAKKLLDEVVALAKIAEKDSGRKLSDEALAAARKKITALPLTRAIKKIVHLCIGGVIKEITSDRSDTLTAPLRKYYRNLLQTLSDPQFVRAAAQKISAGLSDQYVHEIYFRKGVVPVVDHVTRLFEGPDAREWVEKLNWTDVEVLVEEALRPGVTAWREYLRDIVTPGIEAAISAMSRPAEIDLTLDAATGLFENRTFRITTQDVEVPYSKETRANVRRAIEQVQEGIRRKDYSPSRGALCGWCEYQSGCPAWCKYSAICKDMCTDTYNCKKWFDEKTGRLVDGRPRDMTEEEYLRRVSEKFEVTDQSMFRLSFSKMNSFDLCPMNYRKLYLDHAAPKPKSFFSIGLSYHQTMEDLYAYKGPRRQPTLKSMIEIFRKKWISAGYRSREEEQFYFRRGLRMCETYYAEYIDGKYKPAGAAEDYFEFKVGKTIVNGFIDRVDMNDDGSISIIDYKTNPKLYTQEELEDDQQMTMYYLAAREGKLECVNYKPVEAKKFVFQFVNFRKDLETYRKPSDLDAFVETVGRFTEEMQWRQKTYKEAKFDPRVGMLLFPPQDNKYCQSCDHHHICPLKTDMTLSGEVETKGVHFEDGAADEELIEESPDRMATVDAAG